MVESESPGQSDVQTGAEDEVSEHLDEVNEKFLRGEQRDDRLIILLVLMFFALTVLGYALMNSDVVFEAAKIVIAPFTA